jgi:hypothetical protein
MAPAKPTLGSGESLDEFRWFCCFLLTSALHLGKSNIRNTVAQPEEFAAELSPLMGPTRSFIERRS